MSKPVVQIVGLQRSGTKWFRCLLENNYNVQVLVQEKHSFPHERTLPADVVIVLQKRLDHWLNSISRCPANLWQTRPEIFTGGNPNMVDQIKAVELYKEFYRAWANEDVPHVWYHELLHDPGGVVGSFEFERNDKPFSTGGDNRCVINDARIEFYLDQGRFHPEPGGMATSEVC